MVAKGKGKDFYKSTYTHEQLWDMLSVADDWAVEQAGTVWTSAASGMKAAREEMSTHVVSLRTQWTGSAAEEFENRMGVVERYSIESEQGMKEVGEDTMPELASYLKTAQSSAQDGDLYPSSTETYDEWLESKDIDKTKPEYEAKKTQYQQQYQDYLDLRHDTIAQIVADLGDQYAIAKEKVFAEPPPPPPSDMPGNTTYTKPTGGVFAENSLSSGSGAPNAPGMTGSTGSTGIVGTEGADGIAGTEDDLDPVENAWTPGSYTDVDGEYDGLAAGGDTVVPAGGGGYPSSMGGGTNMGGGTVPGGGAGLFPTRTTPTTGAGSAPGRGTGSGSSPARAGASSGSGTRSGSGSGSNSGRGSGSGMNSNRGGVGRNGSGGSRGGGTRSGYSDDDDDEVYTRETWLREDDVDWSRNRVSDEELDED
ncbi:WXG100 family type VII secretion target [Glycomyces harbinensis]|uniref:PPE family protein n=1 Tax=Glycomyces harbinensis TaxID=58114 RepID=A0A1G7CUH6_9ACTN|nr:hypothetical protein [Glycomyces harbinensis]SDE42410.1 hypothetical protein SAMN05216270_12112 [Glycomyces harbinensis]